MRIATESLPDRQVALELEVEPERVERFLEGAFRRLARRTRIPGFRPGMAPRAVVERFVGREALLREALDELLPQVVQEALEAQSLEAIAPPSLEVKSLEPVVVRATVPLKPQVELGDWRQLRVPREEAAVPEEEIQEALEELRRRYATWEPVARPIQPGDLVRAHVLATVEGKTILEEEDAEVRAAEEFLGIPGALTELVGAREGQVREFTLPLPESYPRPSLAGRPCLFRFAIHSVKEEKLPGLDDEFAREVGEGFSSLRALRERIAQDLRLQTQEAAEAAYRERVLEALGAQARLEFPPLLVEQELDRLLRDRSFAAGMEEHLQRLGRSPEEIREELRPLALKRVQRSLILGEVAAEEGIAVAPQEVVEEVERMARATSRGEARAGREQREGPQARAGREQREGPQARAGREQIERLLATDAGREAVGRVLLSRKTMARLVAIAAGEVAVPGAALRGAPDAPATSPKATRRGEGTKAGRRAGSRRSTPAPAE